MLVDTDDLIDSTEVAAILGIAGTSRAVSVLRSRYPDFPQPAVAKPSGRCSLWLRTDIEAWGRSTGRIT